MNSMTMLTRQSLKVDLNALAWLEDYLQTWPGTLLVVSAEPPNRFRIILIFPFAQISRQSIPVSGPSCGEGPPCRR
jgi:hypothetical protein